MLSDTKVKAATLNKVFDTIGYGNGRFTLHGVRSTASTVLTEGGKPDAIEHQLALTERDVERAEARSHARGRVQAGGGGARFRRIKQLTCLP